MRRRGEHPGTGRAETFDPYRGGAGERFLETVPESDWLEDALWIRSLVESGAVETGVGGEGSGPYRPTY